MAVTEPRTTPSLGFAIGLPPERAMAYFRDKTDVVPSWDWREVWQAAHNRAFTVAGVMKVDAVTAPPSSA